MHKRMTWGKQDVVERENDVGADASMNGLGLKPLNARKPTAGVSRRSGLL